MSQFLIKWFVICETLLYLKNDHSTTGEYRRHFEHYVYVLSVGKDSAVCMRNMNTTAKLELSKYKRSFLSNIDPLQFSSVMCS